MPFTLPHCFTDGVLLSHAPRPLALLPGSFNPLHFGHRALAEAAAVRLGVPVHFELSITNVDKPELLADEIERRVGQFVGVGPVWITRAAGVLAKSVLFPGTAFVVGFDTAVRLIDPKYYRGEAGRDGALRTLAERGCRVLVGGRTDGNGVFRAWEAGGLFEVIPEGEFRADVSSTQMRANGAM